MRVIMHIYIDVYIETCGSVYARVSQDLYVDRPLPYLIGSQAFMEQEDVGLGDLSSDGNKLIVASSGTPYTVVLIFLTYVFDCLCRNVRGQ